MIIHTNHLYTATGDLLSTNLEPTRQAILALFEKKPVEEVHLDLRACQLIDSAGLNLVVTAIRLAKKEGAVIQISVSQENIRRAMQVTRIDQHARVVLAKAD